MCSVVGTLAPIQMNTWINQYNAIEKLTSMIVESQSTQSFIDMPTDQHDEGNDSAESFLQVTLVRVKLTVTGP